MPLKVLLGTLIAIAVSTSAAAAPVTDAPALQEACPLLTQDQVGSALGAQVGAGKTSDLHKNGCMWVVADGNRYVTLLVEGPDQFQAGKAFTSRWVQVTITPISGLGEDAYYMAVAKNVGLNVKKGQLNFQVAVMGLVPFDQKQAIEKTLAQQILSRLP